MQKATSGWVKLCAVLLMASWPALSQATPLASKRLASDSTEKPFSPSLEQAKPAPSFTPWKYALLTLSVPRKLKPLLYPKRYKGAHGGRGGAKSHFFAEQALLTCYTQSKRIVCIREVQNSIKDSVRQLLTDKIESLGMGGAFEVLDQEIRGPHNSLIIFKGMQSYNADNIKSLEAYDVAWVEEAQTLSQHSLDLLRPTIRKDGSELWFSWNPRFKTDPVDKFFRGKNPHPDAVVVEINWRDNPWFPAELQREMAHDFGADPDKAEHVWNGAYGSSQGAILSRWVNLAEREGRILSVAYDPSAPDIEISSDLGFRDTAAWWYWQRKLGGFSLLKYEGESGMDADDWIVRLQETVHELGAKKIGKIWLPFDARTKTFQSKHSSVEKFLAAFGVEHVGIVPQSKKQDQISAARRVIGRCEFDAAGCEDGLDGLRAWEFEWNDDNNVFSREPLHNWASHPGDAFAYGGQVMEEQSPPPKVEEKPIVGVTVGMQTVTLEQMWKTEKRSERI